MEFLHSPATVKVRMLNSFSFLSFYKLRCTAEGENLMKKVVALLMVLCIGFALFATNYTLTAEEIEKRGFTTVTEALASLPGVDSQDYYGNSAMTNVSINGSKSSQVDIYLDGIRIPRDYDGTFNLGLISIKSVEKIEIEPTKGIGGIINIYTNSSSGGQLSASNRSLLNSEDSGSDSQHIFAAQSISASYRGSSGAHSFSVGGALDFDQATHRVTETSGNLPVNNYNVFGSYVYSLDRGSLRVSTDYSFNDATTIGSASWVSKSRTKTSSLIVSAFGAYQFDFGKLDMTLSYKNKNYKYNPEVESEWDPATQNKTNVFSFVSTLSGTASFIDYKVGVFGDFTGVINTYQNSGENFIDKGRTAVGIDAKASTTFDKFTVGLDIRIPFTPSTDWHIIANIDMVANEETSTVVSVSGGFSTAVPNMSALYWPLDYSMWYVGNPDLKTEKGWNFDIGITSKPSSDLSYTGSVFVRRTFDLIASVVDPDTYLYTNANVDEALFIGSTQSLSYQVTNKVLLQADASINYTYNLSGDNSISDKIRVNNVRMHTLKLTVGYTGNEVEVLPNIQYLGGYFYNSTKHNATTLIGITVNYKVLDNFTITVKGDNLTDEHYEIQQGYPMPGASITVGATYKFK